MTMRPVAFSPEGWLLGCLWFLLLVVETEERQLRIASLTDHRSKRLWHIATLQPHQPAPLRSREVTILYFTYS